MDDERHPPQAAHESTVRKRQQAWYQFLHECQECQRELAPHWHVCAHCGTRLATHCPGCGHPLPPVGAQACQWCGLALPPVPP
jgi:hypothetical protein